MKKRFYCLLAAVLMAGACICVPVAEVKAEDGYNIDSYDNDDWYDSDDSPTDMVLDLSNVTIDKTSQTGYAQKNGYFYGSEMPTYKFTLQNTPCLLNDYDDGVRFSAECSNIKINVYASLENNVIALTPDVVGKTTVTITINNKTFQVNINTIGVDVPNSLLLSTKQKKQITVKGINGIKWNSSNSSVVSVSKNGTIYAKKTGNAVLKGTLGDMQLGCAVSVVTPARKRTVQKAVQIAKTCTYSQPKRMQEKFYDCSSLVWKSYHKNGVNFGMAYYAPVAADMGKWCVQHKKLVSGGLSRANIQNMKLNPGDVMFETGQKNGRYKGIYHVEMITGYIFYGFDGNGKAELGIQWATGDEKYYPMGQMVGRP